MKIQVIKKANKTAAPSIAQCMFYVEGLAEPRN